MCLQGKTVLVTGATGFIGGRVVERLLLEEGAKVRALVRNFSTASRIARFPLDMIHGDLTEADKVREAMQGCDVVFHCAHDSSNEAALSGDAARGTQNVCAAALAAGVARLVHLSTFAVHGATSDGDLTEAMPWGQANHPYTSAKRATEEVVVKMTREQNLPAVVLQPTIVYGPFCKAWTDKPVSDLQTGLVPLVDGGAGFCNAVYIDDLVDAMFLAATRPDVSGEVFLISGEQPVTWKQFYGAFEATLCIESTQVVAASRVAQMQAAAAREKKTLHRFIYWLRDPKVFWRIAKAPPFKLAFVALKRLLPKERRHQMSSRMVRAAPKHSPSATATKSLHVPNETLLALYKSRTHVRIDKAKRLLGYDPQFDLERGMQLTSQYIHWANHNQPHSLSENYVDPIDTAIYLRTCRLPEWAAGVRRRRRAATQYHLHHVGRS